MSIEREGIQIDFYFDPTKEENRSDRLCRAYRILNKARSTKIYFAFSKQDDGKDKVTITALVPTETSKLNHGFDSLFNKSYPEGLGAGYVKAIELDK